MLQKSSGVGFFVFDEGNISKPEQAILERLEKRAEVLAKLEAARAAEEKKNAKLGIKPVQEVKPAPVIGNEVESHFQKAKKENQKPAEPQQQIQKQKSNESQKVKKINSQDKHVSRQKSQEKAKNSGGFTIEEPVFPSQQSSEENTKAKKNASFSNNVEQPQQNVQRQKSQEKAKRNSSFGKDEQQIQRQRSHENNKSKRMNSAGINVPQAIGNPGKFRYFLSK